MLAPRKTLWSTPQEAIDVLTQIPLQPTDVVVDVGCGDGRVLLQWAEACREKSFQHPKLFLGIDIDRERIETAKKLWDEAVAAGRISSTAKVQFECGNAMEETALWKDATVLYLYLIPRGLRLIRPRLPPTVRLVASYMSPLPDAPVAPQKHQIRVSHQPGAAWPFYVYNVGDEA